MKILKFIPISFLLVSCGIDFLSPTAQQGDNYFSCKKDKKSWIPSTGISFTGDKPTTCIVLKSEVYIAAKINTSYPRENIAITLKNFNGLGRYELKSSTSKNYGGYSREIFNTPTVTFGTTDVVSGEVIISKIDYEKKTICGTFDFEVKEINGSEIIKFTKGEFNLVSKK